MYRQAMALLLLSACAANASWSAEAGHFSENVELATMSFKDFERSALDVDPVVAGARQRADALRNRGISSAQLPDPNFRVGVVNVPIDTFSFNAEDMTMKEVGFQQAFPAYGSLTHAKAEQDSLAVVADAQAADRELVVLRGVRESWLDLYFQVQAISLVQKTQQVFDELVKITTSRYRSGRSKQLEVLRAELEQGKLQDRLLMMEAEREVAATELSHWLGADRLGKYATIKFPELPPLPSFEDMRQKLMGHPLLQASESRTDAAREGVEIARSGYRPESMLDISYGQRAGERSDVVTAMLSFSLPIFTSKRQDRRLQAARSDVMAAKNDTADQHRELHRSLVSEYERYQRLDARQRLYEKEVLPYSSQVAQSSMASYQSGVSGFEDQLSARMQELDSGMEALKIKVDKAKSQARLLYAFGERGL